MVFNMVGGSSSGSGMGGYGPCSGVGIGGYPFVPSPGAFLGGFVDVTPICSVPPPDMPNPAQRMRGNVKRKKDMNVKASVKTAAGVDARRSKASAPGAGAVPGGSNGLREAEVCKAIIVYKPPLIPFSVGMEKKGDGSGQASPAGTSEGPGMDAKAMPRGRFHARPKAFAVRDCPPGMRIQGARMTGAVKKQSDKPEIKGAQKKGKNVVKDDGVAVAFSDSESDDGLKRKGAANNSKRKMKSELPVSKRSRTTQGKNLSAFTACEPGTKEWEEARLAVRNILEKFDGLRRRFVREEESRVKDQGRGAKRPDLRASSIIMSKGLRVNGGQSIIGAVPGIEVGDSFNYRMEMCVVCLHRQSQGGIDFVTDKNNEYKKHLAVSVIASGGYEDDVDNGDSLIYTGQGGNNYKGDKRQAEDQKLLRGNLALKNSGDEKIPVRVIRGCSGVETSPSGKVYYYDGLYEVVNTWSERGASGHVVYKFELHRIQGQPPRASSPVMFLGKMRAPVELWQNQAILKDISGGQETVPVAVANTVDEDKRLPDEFEYIPRVKYPPSVPKPPPPEGCSCKNGGCFEKCPCIKKNHGQNPYNNNGALVRARRLVYECGDNCSCAHASSKCHNRVSQKGVKFRLEVFKSENRGWGVRSWDFIPSGSFICEYVGELFPSDVAEKRENDEYLFDLEVPKSQKKRWGDVSDLLDDADLAGSSSPQRDEKEEEDEIEDSDRWTLDAREFGNVARFINHSCSPNLFVQCVLYDHHDLRLPHVMLFAQENIPPHKELTYDYAYGIDKVKDAFGNVKIKKCLCGSPTCSGRLY